MRSPALLCFFFIDVGLRAVAQVPAAPKPPIVHDPALRIELVACHPEVEACSTVCGAPDGSLYVGGDRGRRVASTEAVNAIVRFSSLGAGRKRTVFADKIHPPAGSGWHEGWLYVLHGPCLTRFKDTNADGVADAREDLVSNLGVPPYVGLSGRVVSGLAVGIDGFLYLSVGDRGIYQARSVKDGSTVTLRGGGILRCTSEGRRLAVFSTGARNQGSVHLDAEGTAFTRDDAASEGSRSRLLHHIEGGDYRHPSDQRSAPMAGGEPPEKPALDHLPAIALFTDGAPAGGCCYLSDGLPEKYRGKHFFSERGKAGVLVTEIVRDGATFKLVSDSKLIEPAKAGVFRPEQLCVAADGSLLIADWGKGGGKDPQFAGAVWRLYWPEARPAPRIADERKAPFEELVAALGHPDRDQRLRAQFELVAALGPLVQAEFALAHALGRMKGTPLEMPNARAAYERLEAIVRDEAQSPLSRFHAIWILESLLWRDRGQFGLERRQGLLDALRFACSAADPAIRRQAARAFTEFPASLGGRPMANAVTDADAGVRMQAFLARKREAATHEPLEDALPFGPGMWSGFSGQPPGFAEWEKSMIHRLAETVEPVEDFRRGLLDTDAWVRAAAASALRDSSGLPTLYALIRNPRDPANAAAWETLTGVRHIGTVLMAAHFAEAPEVETRLRTIAVLGSIACQPVPWDGKWSGPPSEQRTPALDSTVWRGTARALAALTAVLADAEVAVRLASARAFSRFRLPPVAASQPGASEKAGVAPSAQVAEIDGVKQIVPEVRIIESDVKLIRGVRQSVDLPPKSENSSPSEVPIDRSAAAALAALRSRLSVEPDRAVKRAVVAALGVQRDPLAMDTVRQIALDGDADAELRATAIRAVASIGGDAARETIAQLAEARLAPAATRAFIEAAGELKVAATAPALIAHLADADAGHRERAAKALQRLGPKSHAGPALIDALADEDARTQAAAIGALGSFREKAALPAIIALAEERKALKETIGALAKMPDESAIPVLVEALRERNPGIRRNAIKALKAMREKAWPHIEALLASRRMPEELVAEIRSAFGSSAPVN